MFRKACGLLVVCLALAGAAAAYENSRFKEWDKDGNHKLTHAEFYEGMNSTGIFLQWDANRDGLIDRQEIYAGRLRMRQSGHGGQRQSRAGLATGIESSYEAASYEEAGRQAYGKQAQLFSFRAADLNRDGTLDKTEFFTALFRQWDRDNKGFLRKHELREEVLQLWLLV